MRPFRHCCAATLPNGDISFECETNLGGGLTQECFADMFCISSDAQGNPICGGDGEPCCDVFGGGCAQGLSCQQDISNILGVTALRLLLCLTAPNQAMEKMEK